jgi:hypothetical protein
MMPSYEEEEDVDEDDEEGEAMDPLGAVRSPIKPASEDAGGGSNGSSGANTQFSLI